MVLDKLINGSAWVDRDDGDENYVPNFCVTDERHQKYKILSVLNKRK